jgi:hypothetical protein
LRHREQIPVAVLIFGIVLVMALLFWSTAIAMYLRKPVGRKLALISAVAALPIVWPIGTYSWWFMHSEGAKQMYGINHSG